MLKKIFISKNLCSNNNLYLPNIIFSLIAKYKKLITIIVLKHNAYFLNLKNNLC